MNNIFSPLLASANTIIIGKERQIKLAICCLLAKGHLLIEDLPGMGKTTLSHLLAKLFDLEFQRIQFTSDMMPADIIGTSIFNKEQHEFVFIKGPVFSQVVLADEINRSSAKTQSALLEAMEENQVSIDRQTYPLEQPFFVIATQNPRYQAGTFSLPESQLDRFLMCLQLGYPDAITERKILSAQGHREALNHIQPLFSINELINLQLKVSKIHVADAVLDIVQAILKRSRESQLFITGLSPRAGIALINAAKAWAFIHNRSMVIADDIQQVLLPVISHRLQSVDSDNLSEAQILEQFNDIKMF